MTQSEAVSDRSILVTGGQGLIGHALQSTTESINDQNVRYIFLSSKDGDLRDPLATKALFEKHRPTEVIHLAARVGGLFANMADNLGFFNDNLHMNSNVIEMCHLFKVKSAIFCLSTCVFPEKADLPLTEEILHDGPPHPSNEGYAFAKRALQCQVRYYREAFGYNWQCIIPTNIYGPFDNFHLQHSHVIPALIRKAYTAKESGTPFVVFGTGRPLRQFILSEDLARIILRLLELQRSEKQRCSSEAQKDRQAAWGEACYICCGDASDLQGELSIESVARSIADAVGFEGEIQFDSSKSDGIYRKTASNSKLREAVGEDFLFTSFVDGINKTVKWFKENVGSIRG